MNPFLLPLIAWIATLLATPYLLRWLQQAQVMDLPNDRSNHKQPVPRGGGLVMIAVTLICYVYLGLSWKLLLGAALLLGVSFADDRKSLPARVRFLAQLVAVLLAMSALPGRVFPEAMPYFIEYIFIALAWLWFINLTNFMDGIDGISALQSIAQMSGIVLIYVFVPQLPLWLPLAASVLAATSLGFLRFNLSPAQLFMGDAGSIPLGFLGGYLLLALAACGHGVAALILPAYYMTDATFTLLKRAYRREKVWQAHSQHAYQRAVRRGFSHDQVVLRIALLNAVLVVLALLSSLFMMAGMVNCAVAYIAAFLLVTHLVHASPRV